MASTILSDAAVGIDGDLLRFDRYTTPLVDLLTDPKAETPFTIGIFGTWGSGKSTLLKMLNERLTSTPHEGKFLTVNFNAWLYRGEKNMLIPLLHTLHDTLLQPRWAKFKESAAKIFDVLTRLGADVLLKSLTADAVSLENLDKLEEAYAKGRGHVTSELRTLHDKLQQEANTLHKSNVRLVFFIDDLDRCQPDEIIALLEAVKLFLDLQHTFVIIAMDKEVIDSGIQIRYDKFEFLKDRRPVLGAEYLEKMVQLPLFLYPPTRQQIRSFIEDSGCIAEVRKQSQLLDATVLANPRKVKRIINALTVTHQIAKRTGLGSLKPELLTRLTVLRVQHADLYAKVTDEPRVLAALEGVFEEPPKYRVDQSTDWVGFGSAGESIRAACKDYARPTGNVAKLLKGSGFAAVSADELQQYLSMVGA